jgi:hypothetical protein
MAEVVARPPAPSRTSKPAVQQGPDPANLRSGHGDLMCCQTARRRRVAMQTGLYAARRIHGPGQGL